MSSASWVHTFWENRKHLELSITNTFLEGSTLLATIELVNKSKQPISITSGALFIPDKSEHQFGKTSTTVFTYSNPDLSGKTTETTKRFPVKLDSFEAKSILVELSPWPSELNQYIPGPCDIVLGTSRGQVKKSCKIPIYCASWKKMLECIR